MCVLALLLCTVPCKGFLANTLSVVVQGTFDVLGNKKKDQRRTGADRGE